MYKRIFSVRVKDKGNVTDTYIQNCCKNDFEYMIVFIKFIQFFKIALLDEYNNLSFECVESIEKLIEECFIEEPVELCEYLTYFKRFCYMLDEPIYNEMMNEINKCESVEVI